jgi:Fuc2NAc and GlcNAc transferase
MGDAGSIPTGFLLGGLALYGASTGALPLGCWLVLLAGFITDASWTLVERLLRGVSVTEAHREHAYQRLSRYWGSHVAVDFLLLVLHALWLFPLAWTIGQWPEFQVLLVILAYVPLLLGMAKLRALP